MRKILIILFLLLGVGLQAQQRPRVGLVLSGGGARGMAHIGVLKVLEEAGIVPDVITGTSMGSVVGGLYAAGYSADEIDSIARNINWDNVLSNQIPFQSVAIEEKDYYGRYIFDLPVEGLKPGLPKGVIEGQELSEMLSNLTRRVHHIRDFDQLPIPFACVATDIETGERVVLRKGSLAESIRASMAIPSIFTPVELDDRLLVDGGLVRNFPVQEALDMGADIIIGVFVSDDLLPKEKLGSMVDVLVQSAWVMSTYDTREQRKLCNLYIEPDLTGFGTYSFTSTSEIIQRGYNAADSSRNEIENILGELRGYGYEPAWPEENTISDTLNIRQVRVVGNEKISDRIILGKLRLAESSSASISLIESRIDEVFGTGHFEKITYEVVPLGDNLFDLLLKVRESPSTRLKIGLHYNNEIGVGFNVNLTFRNLLLQNSRLLADLDLAENTRTDVNYLKYLGKNQNIAMVLGFRSLWNDLPIFSEGQKQAVFNNRYYEGNLKFMTTFRPTSSYGVQFNLEGSNLDPDVVGTLGFIEKISYGTMRARAFWNLNTMDSPFFPSSGTRIFANFDLVFQNESTLNLDDEIDSVLEVLYREILKVEPHHTFGLKVNRVSGISDKFSILSDLEVIYTSVYSPGANNEWGIGGFYKAFRNTTRFWGADLYEYQTANFTLLRLGFQWQFLANLYLTGTVNYLDTEFPGTWLNPEHISFEISGQPRVFGGGLQLGYMSRIGPVKLNIGRTSNSRRWITGINLGFLL